MTTSSVLAKEKIVSLSELQKNPIRALDASIVRIVKSGKEIGIYLQKDEFEDFVEEHLPLTTTAKNTLVSARKSAKLGKLRPLHDIL